MKRTPLRRRVQLRARKPLRRTEPLNRSPAMATTERQRAAVAARACIVCGATKGPIDPAHLIPRSLGGCGDPTCVVPLCRWHHRAYDRGELDLLPYLESAWQSTAGPRGGARGADRGAAADQRYEVSS